LTPVPDEGPVGGIVVAQSSLPYVGADIQGTLVSKVWQGDPSNPFGGLTFTYEILTGLGSSAPVESFTVGNYGQLLADVSFSAFPGGGAVAVPGVAPVYAGRTLTGNIISYDFSLFGNPGIFPGQNSALLVVQTGVPFYATTIASVINAGSAQVLSFAPIAVPEPATFALFGAGALALMLARKRQ